jgi:2-oxo-4-hydroxy-4-carboxy-5-ureidoimidazoline decarboxylase
MTYTLQQINQLSPKEFVSALGGIFEHSPWVAERVVTLRPFLKPTHLLQAMAAAVRDASEGERLALIRAHPELASKAAMRGELTAESKKEQSSVGLTECTPAEFARMHELNAAYNKRFGFPFIIAVRNHNRQSILQQFALRLESDRASEMRECIEQIIKIAEFRLMDLVV